MKIVLTAKEHEAISGLKRMFGISTSNASVAILSIVKTDKETTIETNPDFTVDYVGLISSIAPMFKGLYHQAMGVVSVITSLGESLDNKWAKPVQKEAES